MTDLQFRTINAQTILSLWVPITFILQIMLWMFAAPYLPPVPDKVMAMLQTLLGLHGGWAAMIIGYYFNSSASSARKDEIIAASPPAPPGHS